MCENNTEGSLGLIINKPMVSQNAADILQKTGLERIQPLPEVYFGGPVNLEMGLILHDTGYEIDGTLTISKEISLTSNKQIVNDLKTGLGPNKFRFSMGYAGWGADQLEKEIENGDWLLIPSVNEFIFNTPAEEILNKIKNNIDIDIDNLSGGLSGLS